MMWEGEEWERNVEHLEAIVKQKEIIRILVTKEKDGKSLTSYYVVDQGQYRDMSHVYSENKITDYTYETALTLAESYRDSGQEYFGN
jgi:hypothetical protein